MELVETKIVLAAAAAFAMLVSCGPSQQGMNWQALRMDGHRTGVTAPNADNVASALGTVDGNIYTSPNGKVFKDGATPAVASIMLEVQPSMARLKEVIAFSARTMEKHRPESELSNMAVDIIMEQTEKLTGRKVDVGILNFGGIRTTMPAGPVMLDDIVSMFPFKNYLTYVAMPGSELRRVLEYMASHKVEVLGGARIVIRNHKLVKAEVGGKPLSDSKVYGLATIDFLVDGGDGLKLARGCREMIITDVKVIDAIEPYIRAVTARGDTLDYKTDGRVIIEKTQGEEKK